MILLYALDIIWIAIQSGLGRAFTTWKREFVPWPWAGINLIVVLILFAMNFVWDNKFYTFWPLAIICALSLFAFIGDVCLIDYYKMFEGAAR